MLSHCSSVSVVTRLRVGRPVYDSWQEQGVDFSLCHCMQTGSGAYPVSYPMGTGGKVAGA
jgi:hypothetical protein